MQNSQILVLRVDFMFNKYCDSSFSCQNIKMINVMRKLYTWNYDNEISKALGQKSASSRLSQEFNSQEAPVIFLEQNNGILNLRQLIEHVIQPNTSSSKSFFRFSLKTRCT